MMDKREANSRREERLKSLNKIEVFMGDETDTRDAEKICTSFHLCAADIALGLLLLLSTHTSDDAGSPPTHSVGLKPVIMGLLRRKQGQWRVRREH
eukprot:gene10142-7099_t